MAENENVERDTHFAGFATLLWDGLLAELDRRLSMTLRLTPKEQEIVKGVFAQHAYDLVYHTLDNAGEPDPADSDYLIKDTVKRIPDMTERPHIIETAQEYDEHMRRLGYGYRPVKQDEHLP